MKIRLTTLSLSLAVLVLLLCAPASRAQAPLAPLDAKHLAAIDDFIHHELVRHGSLA